MDNKVIKNASWIIGCRIAQSVLALIINMLTARYLGPSNYGIINYVASLVAFMTPIMNLGINNILVNELIKNPDEEGKILGTSIGLTFISSIFCVVGLLGFISIANSGEIETIVVCWLYSLLLISQSFELIQFWFQAKLWSKYCALSTLGAYGIVSIYKIWLFVSEKNIYWFAISNAFDYILIAIALTVIYKRKGGQRFSFSLEVAKRVLKQSCHYILPGMMGIVLAQSDRVMLKFMDGNEAVGLYSAAYSIASLTSFVFVAIIDSMRPGILRDKASDQRKYEKNISRLFGVVLYLSMLQSIIVSIFSNLIIYIMYGRSYFGAITTLQIIIWYTSFSYYGAVRNVWILAEEKQKYLWIITFVGMIANVGMNFILIQKYGINGAALATLITQLFMNVVLNWFIHIFRDVNKLAFKGLNIKEMFKN